MYLATSNLKNTMSPEERKTDAAALFASPDFADEPIVLWQELRRSADHDDVIAVEPKGYTHVFRSIPLGMSVPSRYSVNVSNWSNTVGEYRDPATGDLLDAARYFATVKLEDLTRPTLNRFFVINTHFPHGCEWGEPETATNAPHRARWNTHFDAVKGEVSRIKNLDLTVAWGGDHNRGDSGMPAYADNEKQAVGKYAVDKLYVLDRSVVTTLTDTGEVTTALSDHDAKWAKWSMANR